MGDLPEGWETRGKPPTLFRRFTFGNYTDTRTFLDALAELSEFARAAGRSKAAQRLQEAVGALMALHQVRRLKAREEFARVWARFDAKGRAGPLKARLKALLPRG